MTGMAAYAPILPLTASKLSSAEYAENGVSAIAESAYTLTATVMPELAENKAVDWSVSFADSSAEWANGKAVTDYVTITPSADGALTASLACIKDFGGAGIGAGSYAIKEQIRRGGNERIEQEAPRN